ncbi:MAG: hypothetical protein J0H66_04905 [Solirubrobacterales bacterium]|nr:hypothetical protein [Solirubrobacterales bacterium]
MSVFSRTVGLAVLAAAAMLLISSSSAATSRSGGGITLPGPTTSPKIGKILPLARRELSRNVVERRGNNIPRYRKGKGKIAPYSIANQWCAAFSTWIWNKSGFKAYLGTKILWPSHDGTMVGVQVRDLTNWATQNGYFSYRAKPGYLVAYGTSHIGIVEKIDRTSGQAVGSIEGNISNKVARVTVPMDRVTGYISPVKLTPIQLDKSAAYADMAVPPAVLRRLDKSQFFQP